MKINFRFTFVSFALMLCFTALTFGQGLYGSIQGTVVDSNGAAIPNATVKIQSTGSTTGFSSTITANGEGDFIAPRLAPGSYNVSVSANGFKETTTTVTINVDKATPVNVTLTPGTGNVVVDVTTDAAVTIDNTNTQIDNTITKQVFESLPKGTNFGSLLKTAPNVRPESRQGGGFQIDGASSAENVFVIDGQEVTNFRTGQLTGNNNLPFELLQEVQVKSTGFEAEYGGATGGVINVVTAGGNDSWRGNFGLSFEPSKLQGRPNTILNRFDATNSLATGFEQFQPKQDGGTNFFPVANFSGPIIKEKVWFSATYAPQIFNTTRVIDYVGSQNPATRVLSQTTTYDASSRREYAFARVDAQPHSRLRVFGTFLWNPTINDGLLPGTTEGLTRTSPQSVNFGGSIGTLTGPDLLSRQGGRRNSNSFNGQVTWNPLNTVVFNFRGGRTFQNERDTAYFVPSVTRYVCSQVSVVTAAQTGCAQGFQNVGNNSQIDLDVSTRTTFDADANFVGINFAGRHNIKTGYQYNRLFNDVSAGYVGLGLIQLFYGRAISALAPVNPTAPICAVGQTTGCVLGSGLMTRFGTVGSASSDNTGLFVQDSWQIANRLTLNVGVRVENEIVPNFGAEGSNAIKFGWGDKVAPRFGAAFDLTGKGTTKLFASYGWFYDRFKYELPRGSFGGDFFRRDFFEITPTRGYAFTSYTRSNILGSFGDPIGGECPIANPTGYSVCQFDFRIATNLEGADIFETGAIDPDIKAARQSEYTFGIEHQLGNNFVIAGRFTHKQIDRAVEDVGVFTDQGSEAYIIGNPGLGLVCEISTQSNLPCAKAERRYDAIEVRLDKRSTNYFFNVNYTWSRLFGNYSGLASTDENGRSSPNVNRFFDLPPLGFTADGDPDNGRLATDRPHVFKAYGGYFFNWGNSTNQTRITAYTSFQSGVPLTTIYDLYGLGTTILNGRGDLGRTEAFSETDLGLSHRYKFGRDSRFTLEPYVDIRNIFNERNVLNTQNAISTTQFTATNLSSAQGGCTTCTSEAAVFQTIFNGSGIRQNVLNFINANAGGTNGRRNDYNQPTEFQAPRYVRFGFRFFF